MIRVFVLPLFLIITNCHLFKAQGLSQDLIACRSYCCQADSFQQKRLDIDPSMDYIAQVLQKQKEQSNAPKVCYCFVEETTAELSTIVINLNDPKEYSLHSQNLQLLSSQTDSPESLKVAEKSKDCILNDDLERRSCRVFLFCFDKRKNKWIAHASDFKTSSNITPESDGTMHGIGYLICKPPQQTMIDSLAIRIASLSRITAQDLYLSTDYFGCSDLLKQCDRLCQLNIITLRNYIVIILITIEQSGPYYSFKVKFSNTAPTSMCMTWSFIFQSKFIYLYMWLQTGYNNNQIEIWFLDLPFNKDNCSPNCVLLMEGYFQRLLAFSVPIVLYYDQTLITSVFSSNSQILNRPVCEVCAIPQSEVVNSRMIIICESQKVCNQQSVFVQSTNIAIVLRFFVDKAYPIQSNLMVHSIRYTKYDFNTLLLSEKQYVSSFWCNDYSNQPNEQKEYGVTVSLKLDEIVSTEITITLWFQAVEDPNSAISFNRYAQQTVQLNMLQFFEERQLIDQVSYLNAVGLVICSMIIGMICANSQILKAKQFDLKKQKIRLANINEDQTAMITYKKTIQRDNQGQHQQQC